MSTRKRIFILSLWYIISFIVTFSTVVIIANKSGASSRYLNTTMFSLIIPIFSIICGILTKSLSCKYWVICFTILFNLAWIYGITETVNYVYEVSYYFDLSYIFATIAYLLLGYILISALKYLYKSIKVRKIIKNIISQPKDYINVDGNPKLLKVYNKKSDAYEKYLIWTNKAGKIYSSEKIIYYDPIDLIIIDSKKKIYALITDPKKITPKEYRILMSQDPNFNSV